MVYNNDYEYEKNVKNNSWWYSFNHTVYLNERVDKQDSY